jgi:hypothetical protein
MANYRIVFHVDAQSEEDARTTFAHTLNLAGVDATCATATVEEVLEPHGTIHDLTVSSDMGASPEAHVEIEHDEEDEDILDA